MTDYVKAYGDPGHIYHREARSLSGKLRTEATIKEGVIRWNSNDQVPPADCVDLAAHLGLAIDVAKCAAAREVDVDKALAAYRKSREGYEPSDEERFEMRSAFGEGETVVDAITGQTFKT